MVILDVTLCNLVEKYSTNFQKNLLPLASTIKVEGVGSSEILVPI
jgi:hypothetical protein